MLLRAIAILFSLFAHVVFGYALWFRPQSDELAMLDVGGGQEIILTPMGSTMSTVNVTEHAESIKSEPALTMNQKQPAPQPSALKPAENLQDVVGAVANRKSQEVAAVEDQEPLSKAITAAPPERIPDVIRSESSAVDQIEKAAELSSELPYEQKTEDGVVSTSTAVSSVPSEVRADEDVSQAVEKRTPDRILEPEQSLLGGQNLVQDVRNVDQPSARDRVGEMLNTEDRAQAVEPNQPKIGAVDVSPPSTWLEQLKGAQSNGTLALEQLEALEPGVLEVLAQPQQVAIVTGPSSYEAKAGNPSLIGQYVDSVNERVQRSKVNPRTQSTGTVVLKYTVGTDGSLLSMIVISTSGSIVLDGAAISAIHKAAPFPSIPSGVSAKPMTFLQPFKFVLR